MINTDRKMNLHTIVIISFIDLSFHIIGRGSGSFIGGFLISQFGTRQSFRYMGIAGFITGTIYSILYFVWLRSYDSHRHREEVVGNCTLIKIFFLN